MRKLKEDGLENIYNLTANQVRDQGYPVQDLTFIEPPEDLF